jgi:hypothetical protein
MPIFMKTLNMYLNVKYCEVNKEGNLNIAKGTYNLCKVQQEGHDGHKLLT